MRTAHLLTRIVIASLLTALLLIAAGPGFRNRRTFDEHYAKHGREFGSISQADYLQRAQALRDAPAGGPILEAAKPGGVFTRFDRRSGAFGAYNGDRTIRTFFIPNDGERYFVRQAKRPDEQPLLIARRGFHPCHPERSEGSAPS
jgi:pyocin large subunit-like protein